MPSTNDGPTFETNQTSQNTTAENVHFIDGDTPWTYDVTATPDETSKLSGFDDAGLGEFLSRPVKIQQYDWTPGSQLFEKFNPWTNFFDNSDVREKINRFRNLRCKLCLKVLLNGNSFYYGRAMLSYNPCTVSDGITVNRAFFFQDIIGASNKPHILLDPCTSDGGQMCLPFIWPENYLDITQPYWNDDMGDCTIHDFDVLKHANGGTDNITISIYAWAEDVSLIIPTTVQTNVPQSGVVDNIQLDEFGFPKPFKHQSQSTSKKKSSKKANNMSRSDEFKSDGLISKPASAIAKAADMLTMVPYIGPYAKATNLVASKIGEMARIFGYSRPQVMTDIAKYTPRYFGNIANSDAPEAVNKLSLDSKNELTIDTRTFGLGGADELTIQSIASRMTFWKQFEWPESATADSLLASMSVQPTLLDSLSVGPVTELHQTALCFAAAPFEAWQGSIKFMFRVICSDYHRGRLRLVYNPMTCNSGPVAYNQVYSTIIDISTDKEFEYECKWTDIRAWNKVQQVANYSDNAFSTTNNITGGLTRDNGTLSVYVVNELATPSISPADIKIQVWVAGGDDFAVAIPSNKLRQLSYYAQQAEMQTSDDNSPVGGTPVATYGTGEAPLMKHDNQYLVYQGERIVSFKDLLRRYQYSNSYFPASIGTGFRYYSLTTPGMPIFRGWDPNGIDSGRASNSNSSNYNFCSMTLLNYLAPAFVCQRGSIRHKWVVGGQRNNKTKSILSVTRKNISNAAGLFETFHPLDEALIGGRRNELMEMERTTLAGSCITPSRLNNCAEIEIPFYSLGQRFRPARFINMTGTGDTQAVEVDYEIDVSPQETNTRLEQYVSVGEDFTLGMFVGAPIIYSYFDPIAQA